MGMFWWGQVDPIEEEVEEKEEVETEEE